MVRGQNFRKITNGRWKLKCLRWWAVLGRLYAKTATVKFKATIGYFSFPPRRQSSGRLQCYCCCCDTIATIVTTVSAAASAFSIATATAPASHLPLPPLSSLLFSPFHRDIYVARITPVTYQLRSCIGPASTMGVKGEFWSSIDLPASLKIQLAGIWTQCYFIRYFFVHVFFSCIYVFILCKKNIHIIKFIFFYFVESFIQLTSFPVSSSCLEYWSKKRFSL